MHKFALVNKPIGMRVTEVELSKRIQETKEKIEASLNADTYTDIDHPLKERDNYTVSFTKTVKLGVIGPNSFKNAASRANTEDSLKLDRSMKRSLSANIESKDRKVSPQPNKMLPSPIQNVDISHHEPNLKRLPESRNELSRLNKILDSMLEDVRLSIEKNPLPMTKHTLTPDAVQVYDGSVSALEKDLEESGINLLPPFLIFFTPFTTSNRLHRR